ncbi:phosphotriesterase-related protein [Streptoalloteichus tenebrarius]|uniref:Phosphotriesterase-related protein n=2 Tax=Streptoalloteichus tenebrarius (strain ATCC 17920 / DSM 40477 / JCM 4838 / CBS 697.72 / NBRC 16177 / NCIMB 11028 / NRRL B-12390 / A12253. 1 / ISP 5477) TaxID=1933 RepID=A0ABT1I1P7_STRSD|nr:phosphotriesterase [Streptoalloteichus tenebrarius]MCP2261684.1 phosphotriesterase-related protein [Streptoalloteichus tenebrarius]
MTVMSGMSGMTEMPGMVRTVLGDIPPEHLGVCDAHDHLFLRSPMLPGQELDDPAAALGELTAFAAAGGNAVAQWTPWGMGRRMADLPELSRRSGTHIVAATGLHQARHYDAAELARLRDSLAEMFVHELTEAETRAGMIKVAGAFHHLDHHTRHVMAAAAHAHHATDAPIGIHLEGGTAALDALDVLCGTHGVAPHRVLLGHVHRFPDPAIHRQAAETGAFLVFDGPSRAHHGTDWRLMDSLAALVDAGHAHQVLLGGDTVTANARSTADGPGMSFLLTGLRPRVERELGADVATAIFVRNPARAFAVNWRDTLH